MHVIVVHTISDSDKFWAAAKQAHAQLPKGAKWPLAVASTDGTKAISLIVGDSVESVKNLFEDLVSPFSTTEYYEADAKNAVGLPR